MKLICLFAVFFPLFSAFAQESEPKEWTHESEASVVQVSGNTESESYSAKQKTVYSFERNLLALTGRYLQTRSSGIETAKSWDASARYEREIFGAWSAFLQQGAESDVYAGYIQRDNTDVGAKRFFIRDDVQTLISELGARYVTTNTGASRVYSRSGRLYLEYSRKLNETVSARFWAEYLPNFTDSEAWLANYEPSISAMLNSVFSLKLSYLTKYHNKTVTANESKNDTTFTTSLVSKF